MIAMKNKKAISPVIATVLLISIALILALIIFLWASSFVTEVVQKNKEPVENACEKIVFDAEADKSAVYIVNKGNIPLYGVEVNVKSRGGTSSRKLEHSDLTGTTIFSGGTGDTEVVESEGNWGSGDELLVVPIILGESETGRRMHICDTEFGVTISV